MITVSLTDGLKGEERWDTIHNELISYLEANHIDFSSDTNGLIEIRNANSYIDEIVNNFDVIQKVQSNPPMHVSPSAFGIKKLGWGFYTVKNDNLPVVGVIDTGIDDIDPLKPLLVGKISILDRSCGIGDSHGTSVASLVAFGTDLSNGKRLKVSSANLFSIQVIYKEEGNFSFIKLKNAIIEAHKVHNIRIFNLSICNPYSFEYNADYSEYAKMLDELAYIYDLLIFIAAGNLSEDYREYVKCELSEDTSLVNYPNHFYNEHNQCYSQPTNIGSPSESMNNITVGAIASNIYDNRTDLTISHELPSYFSRKYHIDYSQKINDSDFNDNQKNKNIFKPDILMPGGDWLIDGSKMEVLGRGILMNDYYVKLSGTSLATPLAANLAAKIIGRYPDINMQSVKALLINSAETTNIENILSDNIEKIKEKESINKMPSAPNHPEVRLNSAVHSGASSTVKLKRVWLALF
jgi:subtilisin family serine protease